MHLVYFLKDVCVLDLPSDYIFIQMHSKQPTVHSIYIFDTVQNALQLVDFTRQHYFERALLDSGMMHGNIPATNNVFSELHCSCQTGKLRVSQTAAPGTEGDAERARALHPCLAWCRNLHGHGSSSLSHITPGVRSGMAHAVEQRCGAIYHLIVCSWKRCPSFPALVLPFPVLMGFVPKLSAEWRLYLSPAGM